MGAFTAVNEDELLVGSVVGDRYQVGEIIGQGTTGTVFAVEGIQLGRPLAMKVLRPRFVARDAMLRVFHGEARAAWTVNHPCLCSVFDMSVLPDGTPFFVMERLEGETLAHRIDRERLSIASAVDVMMQILSAIETLHQRGVLLRELRPGNVFLAHRRGCRPIVKILDLGLARLVPLDAIEEQWAAHAARGPHADGASPAVLSIPFYLSPERTRSEHGHDASSDLFIAAALLYEALAGQRPFRASRFDGLLLEIARGKPAPLVDLRPDVPPDVDALILRTLSANARSRPASAKELQDELRAAFERRGAAALGSTSIRAAPVSTGDGAIGDGTLPGERTAPPPRDTSPAGSPHGAMHAAFVAPPLVGVLSLSGTADATARVGADDEEEEEEEEATRTDRKHRELAALLAQTVSSAAPSTGRTMADPAQAPEGHDEASADHPSRTVRPPSASSFDIEIDEDFGFNEASPHDEPITSREVDINAALLALRKKRGTGATTSEDEETETMQLTPELRARIEQMTRAKEKERERGSDEHDAPPATHRATRASKPR